MLPKKDLIRTEEYWMVTIQNELFRQLSDYMERENMNRTELAKKLDVSKGYVSQVLSGDCNFTLKKIVQLSLAIGKVPCISFITLDAYLKQEKGRYCETPEESKTIIDQDFKEGNWH